MLVTASHKISTCWRSVDSLLVTSTKENFNLVNAEFTGHANIRTANILDCHKLCEILSENSCQYYFDHKTRKCHTFQTDLGQIREINLPEMYKMYRNGMLQSAVQLITPTINDIGFWRHRKNIEGGLFINSILNRTDLKNYVIKGINEKQCKNSCNVLVGCNAYYSFEKFCLLLNRNEHFPNCPQYTTQFAFTLLRSQLG